MNRKCPKCGKLSNSNYCDNCGTKTIAVVQENNNGYSTANIMVEPEGFVKLWVFVLLYIVTFGIYMYFWIYKTVGLLNKKTDSQDGQVQQLLLCMFVPFYMLYWIYKYSNKIMEYCNKVGYRIEDITTKCIVLSVCGVVSTVITLLLFYLPISWLFSIAGYACIIIAYALLQNAINGAVLYELNPVGHTAKVMMTDPKITNEKATGTICKSNTVSANDLVDKPESVVTVNTGAEASVVEQLRGLKALYDEGIITEEEFNYKKKELL